MGNTLVTRSTPAPPTTSERSRTSSLTSSSTELSLPLSLSMKISSHTRVVSTPTSLERLLEVTPSNSSDGEPKEAKISGSPSTPGVTRVPSRSSRVKLESTDRSTLAKLHEIHHY